MTAGQAGTIQGEEGGGPRDAIRRIKTNFYVGSRVRIH